MTIRPEQSSDYNAILPLTYAAFQTLDFPGRKRVDEHYFLSLLQNSGGKIYALRFVAEEDGVIVGHIFYSKIGFHRPDGALAEAITFGPLSVLPARQKQGIGKALVLHTLGLARQMGYGAVIITGVPDYYPKLGFKRGRDFGLNLADGSSPDPLMAYELMPGYLNGGGVCDTWPPEFDQAERDDEGFNAFHAAFAKQYFPCELKLRPLFDGDIALMQKWLYAPHVAKWYPQPEDWLREIRERRGEFSFLHHFIAEYEGVPVGFCQYYDCFYTQEMEEWNAAWRVGERKGAVYSVDYLIGDPACLRRGFGREMVAQMLAMMREAGAGTVIARPEKENTASNRTLEACGFMLSGEDYVVEFHGNQI